MAAMAFLCAGCAKQFGVTPDQLGKRVRCPHCRAVNNIPPDLFAPQEPLPLEPEAVSPTGPNDPSPVGDMALPSQPVGDQTRYPVKALSQRLPPYWAVLVFDVVCRVLGVLTLVGLVIMVVLDIADKVRIGLSELFAFVLFAFGFFVTAHFARISRDCALNLAKLAEDRKTGEAREVE